MPAEAREARPPDPYRADHWRLASRWSALLLAALPLLVVLDDFWVRRSAHAYRASSALLALSFDLVWGYSGIMSFGQALFFGVAGYSVALLGRDHGVTSIFVIVPACGP